jgi:hypothetical protein
MKATQRKMHANQKEVKQYMKTAQERTIAEMRTLRRDYGLPRNRGLSGEETGSKAEQEKVPKEEAEVKPVRALKKRHGDRNLAVGRHGQPKQCTEGDGGSRKKLAAARRWMTCRASSAPRRDHGCQGPGKVDVVVGTRRGRTLGRDAE